MENGQPLGNSPYVSKQTFSSNPANSLWYRLIVVVKFIYILSADYKANQKQDEALLAAFTCRTEQGDFLADDFLHGADAGIHELE